MLIQPTSSENIWKNIIISVLNRLFFLSLVPKQYSNYLYVIYIVLCIKSNLEMI
jgi:hypothetical protein